MGRADPRSLPPFDDDGRIAIRRTADRLLERIGLGLDPVSFGLPDLLENGLTSAEQDERIRQCVEEHLYAIKDGRRVSIRLIPQMVELIADLFYGREQQAILWKPRGGGGSLCAAIFLWLMMAYRHKSAVDFAGSGEQAKRVYEYTKDFWFVKPGLGEALLAKEPLLSETTMKNGVTLKCCPASEKAARGKHAPIFVADESCQEDPRVGKVLTAGLQGVLSESGFCVLLLSTFHLPFGFFQERWDQAEQLGFKRYKWDVYDIMERCTAGLETATVRDPKALSFCRDRCPLTERTRVKDARDETYNYEGCNGRARDSAGYMPRENVLMAKVLNGGGEDWRVEFECHRPQTRGSVYNLQRIEDASVDGDIKVPSGAKMCVGIDWGSFAVVILAARRDADVAVLHARVFENRPSLEIIEHLHELRKSHGAFDVYPDGANKYCNMEVESAGFRIHPIHFNKWKKPGIENLKRYFDHGLIKISNRGDLRTVLQQLRTLHRDENDNVVKKDDHGPDALLCAMIGFYFPEEFGRYLEAEVQRAGADEGDDYTPSVIII